MVSPDQPTRVQLDGPGPFETPAVVGCLAIGIFQGRFPEQVALTLQDGRELRIPITRDAMDKLHQYLIGVLNPHSAGGRHTPFVTVKNSQAVTNATGATALALDTVERGPIAFVLSLEAIAILRKDLAEAEMMLRQPPGRA